MSFLGSLVFNSVHAQEPAISSLDIIAKQSTDDLDAMIKRHQVRVLVPYSKTEYAIDRGKARGLQADIIAELDKNINAGYKKGEIPTSVAVLPVHFKQLIPGLIAGQGDIAAGWITITPAREQQVDFISAQKRSVDELVVTSKQYENLQSLDDLSGQDVYVLAGSSYVTHLQQLSAKLVSEDKASINIIEADVNLSTDDILEMVNAGIVNITVADDYKALLWQNVLSSITVHANLKVHQGGKVGWAIRKNNPLLKVQLETFLESVKKGTLLGNMMFKRHYQSTEWISNPVSQKEREKFSALIPLFKTYADRYDFNFLALAAQAYQESGLDNSVISSAGALGIMQLLPSTAADPNVNIANIDIIENNIHAGAKYMSFLRGRYFSDDDLSPQDRLAFTWAAYNAGPGRIRKIRKIAVEMGLDPNKWFQNVEYAAMKEVGIETVRYVANIYKYFTAYQLITEINSKRP